MDMKKLLTTLFVVLPYLVHAQLPNRDGKVFYEYVDTCNLTKEQLYNKTKLWLANTFNDSKSVIEVDDKDAGQIVGKGNFNITYTYLMTTVTTTIFFTIKIDIKDDKYRLQLYNFLIKATSGERLPLEDWNNGKYKAQAKRLLPPVDENVKHLFNDYKSSINENEESF